MDDKLTKAYVYEVASLYAKQMDDYEGEEEATEKDFRDAVDFMWEQYMADGLTEESAARECLGGLVMTGIKFGIAPLISLEVLL